MKLDILFDGHGHTIVYVVLTALLSVITFIIGRHFPAKINSKIVKNNINSKVINHGVAERQQNSARKPKRKQSRARKRKFKRMKLDCSWFSYSHLTPTFLFFAHRHICFSAHSCLFLPAINICFCPIYFCPPLLSMCIYFRPRFALFLPRLGFGRKGGSSMHPQAQECFPKKL